MKNFLVKLIKNPIVVNILLMFAVFLIILYATLKWLDGYTRHNEVVIVPDVKGLMMNEAASFLENKGLRYNVIDSVFSKEVPPGAIVEVAPNVGSKVKEGRIVFITLNAFTAQMEMIPDVEDISFRQAYALLRARGFESVEIEYVPGDFKDLVIAVELRGKVLKSGEKVPLASPLVLKVSNGEEELLPVDSLNLDEPVRSLDSEEENWF